MVQKVEVITSVSRRRRYSQEEKDRIVAETLKPGATVVAVARGHDISQSLLFAWRRAMVRESTMTADCRPVPGIAAGIVRQIEVEMAACRQSMPQGRRRICATSRLKGLVALALDSGLTPSQVAELTVVPRSTVKSWRNAARPGDGIGEIGTLTPPLLPPRELALVAAPAASPMTAPMRDFTRARDRATVRIGKAVTIEMSVEALTEAVLRALLAAGGDT